MDINISTEIIEKFASIYGCKKGRMAENEPRVTLERKPQIFFLREDLLLKK